MKKIYILAVAAIFTTASYAQVSEQGKVSPNGSRAISVDHNSNKTPTDTAGWVPSTKWIPQEFALGGQVWNFGYTGGGYIYGVNISANEINHCAQGYTNVNSASFGVEGVLIGFIGKNAAGGGNSSMSVNLYEMSANQAYGKSTSAWAKDETGPNPTAKATTTLTFAAADTNWFTLTYAPFSAPVGINATDFAVSVNATAVKAANDTVGIASDADGEGFRTTYHYIPAQTAWYVTDDLFGNNVDNNIAIFPVIDDNFLGVNDVEFFSNMQLSAFPNPAKTETTISYNLNEDMKSVKLVVYDMTGKEVFTSAKGNLTKGSYNVKLDVSNYNAGNYFYSLIGDGNRMTKRMVVIK